MVLPHFRALVTHVDGGRPACLAVDGPKGPRNLVNPGIALLSQKTGAPVLPISLRAHWRIVFKSTWGPDSVPDALQSDRRNIC